MTAKEQQLLDILSTIQGSGSFVATGVRELVLPGLEIAGLGEIGLPLNAIQAKAMIDLARRAPFGKGSRTITDTTVRSAWEIDADQLAFRNPGWAPFIESVVEAVKTGLGLEEKKVKASLYKLLIYEAGDFFLPHKDSEKEKGMFATLVLVLPSQHTGGELLVRFDGRKETLDLSEPAGHYQLPYAAFYADCEHEIKPVTSGYRVCLVYNLLQSKSVAPIHGPHIAQQVADMTPLLKSMATAMTSIPKAVLLDHQYTPANFSLAELKGHDRPRAEALLAAAEEAGFFARLGLVTSYMVGEWENYGGYGSYGYRRRRYWADDEDDYEADDADGIMGEVHDENTSIKYWGDEDLPSLGEMYIEPEEVITNIELAAGEPTEKEGEGFTGNAGMTIEYWYHYGAVILWPKNKHFQLLQDKSTAVRLEWLAYYTQHWTRADLQAPDYARRLLDRFAGESIEAYSKPDYSPIADALVRLEDEAYVHQKAEPLLSKRFTFISVEAWVALLRRYPTVDFSPIFAAVGNTKDVYVLRHLLAVLRALAESDDRRLASFLGEQVQQLPTYLSRADLFNLERENWNAPPSEDPEKRQAVADIVEAVLALSEYGEGSTEWLTNMLAVLTKKMKRLYVNGALLPPLLSGNHENQLLAQALHRLVENDLLARVDKEPQPPTDWTRAMPATTKNKEIWALLRPFLQSPTQSVFDYVKNEADRTEMERAVRQVAVDLQMETIRKGRPYTLRLSKTMASYQRALENWREDVALLEQLRGGEG